MARQGIGGRRTVGSSMYLKARDLSIQIKLIVVIMAGLSLAVVVTFPLVSGAIRRFESSLSSNQFQIETELTVSYFDAQLDEVAEIADLLAADAVLGTAVAVENQSTLNIITDSFQTQYDLDYIYVIAPDKQPLIRPATPLDAAQTALIEEALMAGPQTTLLLTEAGWLIISASPIVDPVAAIGAVAVGRILDSELLNRLNFERTEPILQVYDEQGNVLARSQGTINPASNSIALSLWQSAFEGEIATQTQVENDIPMQTIYSRYQRGNSQPLVYSIAFSLASVRALERQLDIQSLVVSIGIGIVVTIFLYLLTRRLITNPLVALGSAAEEIGAGRLDTLLPSRNNDEIGRLAKNFNQMAANLQLREKELVEARDGALEANRVKSEILARVSHELRTPLGTIKGYSEILDEGIYGSLTPQQLDVVQKIIKSATYLTSTVNELLLASSLEANQLDLNPVSFPLESLVDDSIARMMVLAQQKGLKLNSTIDDDVPTIVYSDPVRLQQILVNLLGNAIKFTNEGGITLHLFCIDARWWGIEVNDTGIGIPESSLAYIFEPFRQVDGSSTRVHEGTGLGLSIVRELTRLLGGAISVESKVGEGSTFTVKLPFSL
ncbi:MAG: ATP-binding protein [Chloroflexota bacterium]